MPINSIFLESQILLLVHKTEIFAIANSAPLIIKITLCREKKLLLRFSAFKLFRVPFTKCTLIWLAWDEFL